MSPTWDGTLHPQCPTVLENSRGQRAAFPDPADTLPGPLTQKGKLRQGTEHSQAHPQRWIQALSMPQAQW